jgi:surface antigen
MNPALELGFSVARRVLAHGRNCATRSLLMAAGCAAAALLSGACSITMPFEKTSGSLITSDAELSTGSVSPRARKEAALAPGQVSVFSPKLDAEDWRRALAALVTALDPQGNGGHVLWDNGASRNRGSFAPVGNAFVVKDEICRVYVAMVAAGEPEEWFQGTACRISASEWLIKDAKPWKRPG